MPKMPDPGAPPEDTICCTCKQPLACYCIFCQQWTEHHQHSGSSKARLCQKCISTRSGPKPVRFSQPKPQPIIPPDAYTVETDGRRSY